MNRKLTILIVDDDLNQASLLAEALRRMGHAASPNRKPEEILDTLRQQSVHLIITDLRMPGLDGLSFLRQVKEIDPDTEVLLITAYASVASAVEAMRLGALDYLEKPVDLTLLSAKIAAIQDRVSLKMENRSLKAQLAREHSEFQVIGKSPAFKTVLTNVVRAADSDAPVMILGESGTGKEVLARLLHAQSRRSLGPFVPINCGAIPENLVESEFFGHVKGAFTGADKARPGRIEDADGGTLFLDEIGEFPLSLQPKLLRVIQDGGFGRLGSNKIQQANVRWVSATHRDAAKMAKEGTFREDLYYRLSVIPISIPPLRERREDIPEFVGNILKNLASRNSRPAKTLSAEALEVLQDYHWPGNIRELQNTLERLYYLVPKEEIDSSDLPSELVENVQPLSGRSENGSLGDRVAAMERQTIMEALRGTRGNQSEAARRLGLNERTLRYKMKKLIIPSAGTI